MAARNDTPPTDNAPATRSVNAVSAYPPVASRGKVGSSFPAAWGTEPIEVLTGYDIEEKETLIGVPFLITKVQFRENDRQVHMVDVTAMRGDGTVFMFNDSSGKGVKGQLIRRLSEMGQDAAAAVLDFRPVPLRLACLGGLRVSEYMVDVADDRTGRFSSQPSKTYYLRLTAPTE